MIVDKLRWIQYHMIPQEIDQKNSKEHEIAEHNAGRTVLTPEKLEEAKRLVEVHIDRVRSIFYLLYSVLFSFSLSCLFNFLSCFSCTSIAAERVSRAAECDAAKSDKRT